MSRKVKGSVLVERVLTREEARLFLQAKGVTRRGPHRLNKKIRHWLYCSNCGVINLKNEATRKHFSKQCEWVDDE